MRNGCESCCWCILDTNNRPAPLRQAEYTIHVMMWGVKADREPFEYIMLYLYRAGQRRPHQLPHPHIHRATNTRESQLVRWQSRGNDVVMMIDDFIIHWLRQSWWMIDTMDERHTGTPNSMKFPCGLMCRSWWADIPHRAVATVQIQWGEDTRGFRGSAVLWCNNDSFNMADNVCIVMPLPCMCYYYR